MLAISVSDAERYLIPDALSLPSIPTGILLTRFLADHNADQLTLEHVGAAIFGAALLYGVRILYFAFRHREGLGLGDVKLGAAAGAWTGMQGTTHVLLFACLSAISYVGLLKLWRKPITATTAVPLGVFLAPAIWVIWCFEASDAASNLAESFTSWLTSHIT
jgi:leader peptidase (prepilin peptidase)/N-methyltransferase